jgi:transcriptional regulator with XRE-family HTH domain
MAVYRCYLLSGGNEVVAVVTGNYPDEASAIGWAEAAMRERRHCAAVEVWRDDRVIHRSRAVGCARGAARRRAASPAQCRAARALLGWTQAALAAEAGVGQRTVADFERGCRGVQPRTLRSIAAALEAAGVEFTWTDAGGQGVQLAAARLGGIALQPGEPAASALAAVGDEGWRANAD